MGTYHGEFPWQVALKIKGKNGGIKGEEGETFCGGTLINSWTVVTAAHCLSERHSSGVLFYPKHAERFILGFGFQKATGKNKDIKKKNIKFGQQVINIDLRKFDDNGKPVQKKGKVIIHPDYKGKETVHNGVFSPDDIALIILPHEVDFPEGSDIGILNTRSNQKPRGSFVRPICMPQTDVDAENDFKQVIVTGFGDTNTADVKDKMIKWKDFKRNLHVRKSGQLRMAAVKRIMNDNCTEQVREKAEVSWGIGENQFCSAGKNDTCQGDSGGPAIRMVDSPNKIYKAKTQAELIGVTSFGFGCGTDVPGVYTRIFPYMGWIKKYTKGLTAVDGT